MAEVEGMTVAMVTADMAMEVGGVGDEVEAVDIEEEVEVDSEGGAEEVGGEWKIVRHVLKGVIQKRGVGVKRVYQYEHGLRNPPVCHEVGFYATNKIVRSDGYADNHHENHKVDNMLWQMA